MRNVLKICSRFLELSLGCINFLGGISGPRYIGAYVTFCTILMRNNVREQFYTRLSKRVLLMVIFSGGKN